MIILRNGDRTSKPASCSRPGVLSLICSVVSLLSLGNKVHSAFLLPEAISKERVGGGKMLGLEMDPSLVKFPN